MDRDSAKRCHQSIAARDYLQCWRYRHVQFGVAVTKGQQLPYQMAERPTEMLPPSPNPFRPLFSLLPLLHPDVPFQNRKSCPLPTFDLDCESPFESLALTERYPVHTGEYDVEQTPGVKRASAERKGLANDEPREANEKAVSR